MEIPLEGDKKVARYLGPLYDFILLIMYVLLLKNLFNKEDWTLYTEVDLSGIFCFYF